MAASVTPRNTSYSNWYTDIILNAKLADYGPVKGTMVIRPRGYAIWEQMQRVLDTMFKESGHYNAYFPLLIPEKFLQKEAEHVKGFAPETAVVTHGGGEKLEEPLVVRPTSETIIWSMYKKWIQSHRDLPILTNQWVNVLRWEKRTRPFLRTSEFLWQEGHTAHATQQEAHAEAKKILSIYEKFTKEWMAMPVLSGIKTDAERFAGAVETYTIEAMMQDKKALQAGTSHFLGQNFARAFDVTFQNEDGKLEHVWATSWGVSTRLIGALIMVHSDDRGLALPPKLAPIQVVIIPIYKDNNKKEVMQFAERIYTLCKTAARVTFDDSDQNSPGWKFSEWELQGVPLRIECGPRDMENDSVTIVRRDTGKKMHGIAVANIGSEIDTLLEQMQHDMFQSALEFREAHTQHIDTYPELKEFVSRVGGFAYVPWDGSPETEKQVKEETGATIRLLPSDGIENAKGKRCAISGSQAHRIAVFARSY